jgi:hypothetical protein
VIRLRRFPGVLFKQRFLPGLADGSITVAFRRWRRPTVRAGGTLQTPAGQLAIDRLAQIGLPEITEDDARQAGYGSLAELLAFLNERPDGDLYRIEFHRAGDDPRAALREQAGLTPDDLAALRLRLDRLDRASTYGPWTRAVLRLIEREPDGTRAGDLAALLGRETEPLKLDIRKLKALGLTESLGTGYRLSPRGRVLLGHLEAAADESAPTEADAGTPT